MTDGKLLGPWLRRFLEEHLVTERNLSRNTQLSYRDTFVLLLRFLAERGGRPADRLTIRNLTAGTVRAFLTHLEQGRGCSPQTRNQRLAAIRSFARYVASHRPEDVAWCIRIRAIPLKKTASKPVGYLEKPEVDALLATPRSDTPQGRRDRALLQFLYSTGARVSEAAGLVVADLQLKAKGSRHAVVTLRGKGGKTRLCPLLHGAAEALATLVEGRSPRDPVFRSRRGQALTRSGIRQMVRRRARQATRKIPSRAAKRVTPHTLRHSAATHLLRAGVDLNTIRAWLGHANLQTTTIYAEIDLETKAKAVAACEVPDLAPAPQWQKDRNLMAFLRSL